MATASRKKLWPSLTALLLVTSCIDAGQDAALIDDGTCATGPRGAYGAPDPATNAVFDPAIIDVSLSISLRRWTELMNVRAQCGLRPRCEGQTPADLGPCCPGYLAKTWVPAEVTLDGQTLPAEVRLKGNPADWRPEKKPQFVIRVDHADDTARLQGLRRLNLEASPSDRTLVRNNVAMRLMAQAGVVAPRTNHARLTINGTLFGLYENIESVDDVFLRARFPGPLGNLYKHGLPNNRDVGSGPKTDLTRLSDLWDTDAQTIEASAPCLLDVDNFLTEMAVEAALPASDNFLAASFNMFLYNNPQRGFTVIPWDLDDVIYDGAAPSADPLSLAGLDGRPGAVPSELGREFMGLMRVPAFQEQYLDTVRSLNEQAYATLPQRAEGLCCAVRASLVAEQSAQHPWRVTDSFVPVEVFESECADVVARLRCRRTWVDTWFAGGQGSACDLGSPSPISCAGAPVGTSDGLRINELSVLTGRVELINVSLQEASTAGLSLRTQGVVSPLAPWVLPAGARLVINRDQHELELPDAGALALLDGDGQVIESVEWCDGGAHDSACRWPDGAGPLSACIPTFGEENAVAEAGAQPHFTVLPSAELCPRDGCGGPFEPTDLALGQGQSVWVVAPALHSVLQLSPTGELARYDGLAEPLGIAADASGKLWVVEGASSSLRGLDPVTGWDENLSLLDTLVGSPRDLALGPQGWLIVDNRDGLYALDGQLSGSGVVDAGRVTLVGSPVGTWDGDSLALDPLSGTPYVTSPGGNAVVAFVQTDAAVAAGSPVVTAAPGPLGGRPTGVAVDPTRRALLISDDVNGRILVHDLAAPEGADYGLRGSFGRPGSGCNELSGPQGLSTDGARIAVSDANNGRVLVFDSSIVFEALSW